MAGGRGGDLSGHAAQALLDELLQAPARAIAGEHREVMKMDGGGAMGLGNLLIIDLRKPIVCGDGAGVGQDESTHGIGDRGILLDAPVVDLEVVVHQILVV